MPNSPDRNMNQVCRKSFRFNMRKAVHWRIAVLRHCLRSLWNHVLACWMVKSATYRQLQHRIATSSQHSGVITGEVPSVQPAETQLDSAPRESTSDLVPLKITLLGDSQIGKTSFLAKYVGKADGGVKTDIPGINQMDKTLSVQGARISYRIWEVNGNTSAQAHIPEACKDSVAILYMFDLTSRCTLNGVGRWYKQAKKWNQTAIPVLVGTKFDEFIQMPIDMQWTIANEARTYAKAMDATLFFSSATYNINVNKIFKFVTAKLFNLSWTVERNLTIGEPIIDF